MASQTRQDMLADYILNSRDLVSRFVAGFDDSNHTKQTPDLPNHFAWCMGHLALTMHRVAEAIDGAGLPASDFLAGASQGDQSRFGTETISFASKPVDNPAIYPTHARCQAIFSSAIDRLANAVRHASDQTFDKTIKWGKGESSVGLLIPRMLYHNGVHTGQLIDLRRALGMKPVLV